MTRRFTNGIHHVIGATATSRPRPGHQRPGDGVDDGRVLVDPRLQPGHRHRQAPRPRRRPRSRGGHRAGRRLRARGLLPAPGPRPRRPAGGGPGVRQRRVVGGRRGRAAASVVAVSDVAAACATRPRARRPRPGRAVTRPNGSVVDIAGRRRARWQRGAARADVDVLVPPRSARSSTGTTPRRAASVVLEAANYPATPDGRQGARRPGRHRDPDVLANAGGVTGSYFEWTQNIQQFTWKERFNGELRDRMRLAYEATAATAPPSWAARCARPRSPSAPAGRPGRPPARLRVIARAAVPLKG